uniref:CD48 antigen n=1 Tax=Microcebus murinus TaxID=30608 RepID=A0A8C5Y8H5_MICMU
MSARGWEWCLAVELLLLPLLFLATNAQGHSTGEVIVVSGSNVSLQISKSLPDNYKQLTWFYTIHQKIVEWDSGKSKYFNTKFKGRVVLDPESGALNIYNVQKEDSSTYLMRVSNATGKEQEWKILLKVFDPVPTPAINIEKTEETNNTCYLKLSCVIPDQSVNYTWYADSGLLPEAYQRSVLELRVPEPQKYSKFYTCEVSNPVSSKNDTVYFIPPCTLGKKHPLGTWSGHRVTSFLLNEERCGRPPQPPGTECWWSISKVPGRARD